MLSRSLTFSGDMRAYTRPLYPSFLDILQLSSLMEICDSERRSHSPRAASGARSLECLPAHVCKRACSYVCERTRTCVYTHPTGTQLLPHGSQRVVRHVRRCHPGCVQADQRPAAAVQGKNGWCATASVRLCVHACTLACVLALRHEHPSPCICLCKCELMHM